MPSKTVLVVDDESKLVEVIESQLKTVGYQVLTAGEGNLALELAKSRKPDIILLDILMSSGQAHLVPNIVLQKFLG